MEHVREESRTGSAGLRFLHHGHGDVPILKIFVVPDVGTRRIVHWNATEHPTADWIMQQFRGCVAGDGPHRFVIHDRDSIFSWAVDHGLAAMGLRVLKTPASTPQANAWCERLIGTVGAKLRGRRAIAAQTVILAALLVTAFAQRQAAFCDPDLPSSPGHPYGYRERGDRCEGIYIQEVALATLHVASFTQSFEDFDPHQGQDLQLEWTPPRAAEVRIRATGIEPRVYFRMDTTRAPGATSYGWPAGVLAGLGIRKQKLGVVAWTEQKLGPGRQRVYLPLRVRQRQPAVSRGAYELLLVPGRELKEVFVRLAGVRDDGTQLAPILSGQPLGRGYYPARRAIPIEIPAAAAAGVYSVELGAELPGKEIVTTVIYFHHAG